MPKISITPSGVVVNNIQNLPDVVIGDATNLKATFDKTGLDEKSYINNVLITELNGDDGSFKIGHDSPNLASNNVGDALEELQSNIQSAVIGSIPDGTLADVKLSDAAGQVKARLLTAEGEIDALQTDTANIKSDLNYLLSTVVSRQIRIPKIGGLPVTKFRISSSIATGTQITISLDGGATSLPLVDTDLGAITKLESGIHEVFLNGSNYILNPFGQVKELFAQLQLKANKTQENWIEPTLTNGWVNSGAGREVGYFKDDFGIVHLKGLTTSGLTAFNTVVFTLPSGYRPNATRSFVVRSYTTVDTFGVASILSNGDVVFYLCSANGMNLDGITFRAEA